MELNGYIDLQVNGYAGVDFNQDNLIADDLHFACRRLHNDGVDGILATIITDTIDAMCSRLRRIVELRERDELVRKMVLGLHIEGPFISSASDYHGAHPPHAIRPADTESMKVLLAAAGGLARIVTLAPEHDPGLKVTRLLSDQEIIAAAGHCNPSLDQLDAAIDAGLTMFTHVGNGCPMIMHRHDNIIQRALHRADRLWLSFIADGVHVDFCALSNYLRIAGDRALVVSDAMSAAGIGPGRFRFGHWDIEVGDDLVVWSPNRVHLLGSAMTMKQARENLTLELGLKPLRVQQLLRTTALELLGIETRQPSTQNLDRHRRPAAIGGQR
jgi:N-acetylglucosamine-6-phosphate deacetylase